MQKTELAADSPHTGRLPSLCAHGCCRALWGLFVSRYLYLTQPQTVGLNDLWTGFCSWAVPAQRLPSRNARDGGSLCAPVARRPLSELLLLFCVGAGLQHPAKRSAPGQRAAPQSALRRLQRNTRL